jgi:hypothetical protein
MLIGGIVLLIIGIIIAAGSSAAQTYSIQYSNECQSLGGQLGQFFSNERQQNCQTASVAQAASSGGLLIGGGLALIGVILAVIGGAQMARSRHHIEKAMPATIDHAQIGNGKIFCRYCGKLRPVSGTLCSECAKPSESKSTTSKKCIHCQASMSEDSEFCANCGRKF